MRYNAHKLDLTFGEQRGMIERVEEMENGGDNE